MYSCLPMKSVAVLNPTVPLEPFGRPGDLRFFARDFLFVFALGIASP